LFYNYLQQLDNIFSQPAHNPFHSLIQKSIVLHLHKHLVVVVLRNPPQQLKEKQTKATATDKAAKMVLLRKRLNVSAAYIWFGGLVGD